MPINVVNMRLAAILATLIVACALLVGVSRAQDESAPSKPRPRATGGRAAPAASPPAARRAVRVSAAALGQSIALGRQYLLNSQRANGRCVYEYDAERAAESVERNIVREMGALWALAVLHRHEPTPATAAAITK